MRLSVVLALLAALWLASSGCESEGARGPGALAPAEPPASTSAQRGASAEQDVAARVLITDRDALAVVAAHGGELARVAFAVEEPHADNARLWREPAYRSLVERLVADLAEIEKRDPQAGVGIRGRAHRLFDARFLRSRAARFELVGIANRMDRRALEPQGCGEVRLVYRLAYGAPSQPSTAASRLPMTVAVELRAAEPDALDCATLARRWLLPAQLSGRALGEQLVSASGPLGRSLLARSRIVQVATNLQTVRWPSAVRPDLGGHAEYALRAFAWHPARARYEAVKLENTPDVARLTRDPRARARLLSWLRAPEQLAPIDQGTVRLPDEFLAEAVVSVAPRALARRKNRPYRQLFEPAQFSDLELSARRFARSPEALLRRLDDLTCSGCHQSRAVAGFHLLGEDDPQAEPGLALASGSSPHLLAERQRREGYVQALAQGGAPDEARPLAERVQASDGGYGAHCGLGDPGFSDWRCADGLRCDPYEAAVGEDTVGVCLPPRAETGDPCEGARVEPNADPARERVRPGPQRRCGGVCERTAVGFPGGMCAADCSRLPSEAACGAIALLAPFNACLAQGQPFAACARAHVRPAGLRACGDDRPCRDDYVCLRGFSAPSAGSSAAALARPGVCLPPYFVAQLRVDGHPDPS